MKLGSMEDAHAVIKLIREDAFRRGASAMQSKIVAFLVIKNQMELAPQVLGLEPPEESRSERMTIE